MIKYKDIELEYLNVYKNEDGFTGYISTITNKENANKLMDIMYKVRNAVFDDNTPRDVGWYKDTIEIDGIKYFGCWPYVVTLLEEDKYSVKLWFDREYKKINE